MNTLNVKKIGLKLLLINLVFLTSPIYGSVINTYVKMAIMFLLLTLLILNFWEIATHQVEVLFFSLIGFNILVFCLAMNIPKQSEFIKNYDKNAKIYSNQISLYNSFIFTTKITWHKNTLELIKLRLEEHKKVQKQSLKKIQYLQYQILLRKKYGNFVIHRYNPIILSKSLKYNFNTPINRDNSNYLTYVID